MTFLAVRRWFGWSAGRLLVLDIGGGSLEIAAGIDEDPDVAVSLPLGAGRLTRERLRVDPASAAPPSAEAVDKLREYVDGRLDTVVDQMTEVGWDRAVATSKTFRTLARLAGAAPSGAGLWAPRSLTRAGLRQVHRLHPAHPTGAARASWRGSARAGPTSCWPARWWPRR